MSSFGFRLVGPNSQLLTRQLVGSADPQEIDLTKEIDCTDFRLRIEGEGLVHMVQTDLSAGRRRIFSSLVELRKHGSCAVGLLPGTNIRLVVSSRSPLTSGDDAPEEVLLALRVSLPVRYAARIVDDAWQPRFLSDGSCSPLGTTMLESGQTCTPETPARPALAA